MSLAPGPTGALLELARLVGVQSSYQGSDEREHRVDTDVIVAVLRALNIPIEREEQAAELLAAERARRSMRVLEPVVVRRLDDPSSSTPTTLPFPSFADPSGIWLTVALEDGRLLRAPLSDLLEESGTQRRMRLPVPKEGEFPPGYHEISLEGSGLETRSLLIAAPRCPLPRRGWGVFCPLYALRTEDDWGVASYPDIAKLGEWVGSEGGSLIGALPLYPTFLDEPADPSPYLPVTRLGYSELYIDPAAVPELDAAPDARALLDSPAFAERVAAARRSPLVPYGEVYRLRRAVLEPLASALVDRDTGLRAFAAQHPELLAYARFRAVAERHGRDRRSWGADVAGELARLSLADPVVRYHLCAQWLASRQLGEAAGSAPIYGDLPVGVHPDGFDPFWEPDAFAPGAHGGAPPDRFYAAGQDWSFPPLHPVGLREQRYRYFIDVLRVAFAHAAALRIDHVMGLHRLYWIPAGFDARHGAYVSYAAEELHAVVALEAHRAGAVVVGEDLGTVDPSVREAMARDRMLRSWVFEFQSTAEDPLPEPPRHCVASIGTHDTPRFAAFFRGATAGEPEPTEGLVSDPSPPSGERARWRRALAAGLEPDAAPEGSEISTQPDSVAERAALAGCLAHLARSKADLVLVDMGDLIGEVEQENRPGTGSGASNWRHRAALTYEQIRADKDVAALVTLVARERACHAPPEEVGVR